MKKECLPRPSTHHTAVTWSETEHCRIQGDFKLLLLILFVEDVVDTFPPKTELYISLTEVCEVFENFTAKNLTVQVVSMVINLAVGHIADNLHLHFWTTLYRSRELKFYIFHPRPCDTKPLE